MHNQWIGVAIAAAIALLIIVIIEFVGPIHAPKGENLISALEAGVMSLLACSYVGGEVAKSIARLIRYVRLKRPSEMNWMTYSIWNLGPL